MHRVKNFKRLIRTLEILINFYFVKEISSYVNARLGKYAYNVNERFCVDRGCTMADLKINEKTSSQRCKMSLKFIGINHFI